MLVSKSAHQLNQNPVQSGAAPTPQTLQEISLDKTQLAGLVDKVKKTIDMLGDGLKALDISERESLRPMWAVLKEGLEILNGEPDDWDFSSATTQDQLKQLSLILKLHEKKFESYINAEQQKQTGQTSFGKVCTILSGVCEALSSELTKFTSANGTAHTYTQDEHTSHLSKLEFLTLKTQLSGANSPEIKKLMEILNSAWNCASSADIGRTIAFDFSDGSGMNSKTLDKLTKAHQKLTKEIKKLEVYLPANSKQLLELASSNENSRGIPNKCQQVLAHIKQVQIDLENRISEIKDYQSPDTKEKICNAKKIEVQATINLLKSQTPQTDEIKTLIKTLEDRIGSIVAFQNNLKEVDSAKLVGKKEIKGIRKLFNFSLANKQESLLRHMANEITDLSKPNSSSVETEYFTERMLMQSVLERAGIKDASKQLKVSISRELNSRPWSTIESEFTVPVEDKAHQSKTATRVMTTTKHAGELLTDPNHIRITSKDSPITTSATNDYKHTDNTGKTVTGGFNSHCSTEVNHVTTAATTACTVDGEEVFGATRHGTLAPYGLDEAGIKSIPDVELGQTIQSLFEKAEVENTTINTGVSDQTNTDITATTPIKNKNPLHEEFINELTAILLATENGQRDPPAMQHRIRQLMADPSLQSALAGLVKANPVLGGLIQRQGALNRAREVFILEMTRNPQFLKQIQNNETLLFTSVGLLTPDNLRHQLHKLFGFSASGDEKEMVALQAQAWKDLRAEIAAGRIEINGKPVKANILDFNLGVNKGATIMATNPIIGEAVSGWDYVNGNINNESMTELQKITEERIGKIQTELNTKIALRTSNPPTETEALKKLDTEIKTLSRDIATIKELSAQIAAMWEDGSYRDAGNEPYKLASRVALLSHLLGGGTVFNCKSGKDRTAQLDVEVKFLAFQIRTSNGKVPKPNRKRTNLEKIQFATFIFFDESRRKMQELNTGYGGSKLVGQPALYGNFTPSTGDANKDKQNMTATIQQFQGLSKAVNS